MIGFGERFNPQDAVSVHPRGYGFVQMSVWEVFFCGENGRDLLLSELVPRLEVPRHMQRRLKMEQ